MKIGKAGEYFLDYKDWWLEAFVLQGVFAPLYDGEVPMTLSQERIDGLVERLERYAHQHPQGYRLRVALLVALGYAYIVLILGGLALLLFALTAVQYAVLVLIGLSSLFWIRVKPPKGVRCDRARFPRLFNEIDRLCATLNAPKPDHVILTDDLNAAVLQVPKFGLFAWYTNYLLLGLPLMQSVSAEQFRATLAHEMGHLSGNHSRFSGWVYRIRRAWHVLAAQQGDRGSILLYPFFKWYEPFFQAYSFVLSRSDEYVADRCSAEYAGVQNAAEDLIQIYVQGAHAARIWSDIYQQISHQETPPDNAISTLLERLATDTQPEKSEAWLEMALAYQTNHEDTHPSLAKRLKAYGYPYSTGQQRPQVPFPVEQTAASYFLGNEVDGVVERLNTQWKEENAQVWRKEHGRSQMRLHFRNYLAEQAPSLTVEEALKLATLTAVFEGNAVAIPQLQALVQRAPDQVMASYTLGEWLLKEGQLEGVEYLDRALRQNPSLLIPSFEALYVCLKQHGHTDKAQTYLHRFQQLYPIWQRSQQERKEMTARDRFFPHGLPKPETEQIARTLARYPELREAYLVQREMKYLPENPFYVLGIVSQVNRQNPMYSLYSWELAEMVSQTLCLAANIRVIPLNEGKRDLYQVLRRVADSRVV